MRRLTLPLCLALAACSSTPAPATDASVDARREDLGGRDAAMDRGDPRRLALESALRAIEHIGLGHLADAAWVAEQALRSGACSAVLWWQTGERGSAAAMG